MDMKAPNPCCLEVSTCLSNASPVEPNTPPSGNLKFPGNCDPGVVEVGGGGGYPWQISPASLDFGNIEEINTMEMTVDDLL